MIVPSIDLQSGRAVQLVGGERLEMDAGDPRTWAQRFTRVGTIAVVDLDGALGQGSNEEVILSLLEIGPCRVGGGIRSLESARRWLDAGVESIVLGTAAQPEFLRQLPRDRLIAALDARNDEVVVEGWRRKTGTTILQQVEALRPYVAGFLVTFVEREGRLGGTRIDAAKEIAAAAGEARVTIAGGVTTADEIAELDRIGCDAQVGMALYKKRLTLADAFAAPLVSDRPDKLWPTVVADDDGVALGLAYSSRESLSAALESGSGIYHSRRRGLWTKGETSGASQELIRVAADCDRDSLRFTVRQADPGFCHAGTRTCWGNSKGVAELARRLAKRRLDAPADSYTRRLLEDRELLHAKLQEEAAELACARTKAEIISEAADLVYFALVKLLAGGATWEQVQCELDRRQHRITRRGGEAKEA
jgi:phosphoribosyl-ATP pyrophosphohydrolase